MFLFMSTCCCGQAPSKRVLLTAFRAPALAAGCRANFRVLSCSSRICSSRKISQILGSFPTENGKPQPRGLTAGSEKQAQDLFLKSARGSSAQGRRRLSHRPRPSRTSQKKGLFRGSPRLGSGSALPGRAFTCIPRQSSQVRCLAEQRFGRLTSIRPLHQSTRCLGCQFCRRGLQLQAPKHTRTERLGRCLQPAS